MRKPEKSPAADMLSHWHMQICQG